jgi:Tol biopolymer transport system component
MTTQRNLELLLRAHFEDHADRATSNDQLGAVLDATAGLRQRPTWLAALRSPSMTATATSTGWRAAPRAAWLLVAVGLLAAALLAAYLVGSQNRAGPAINGQIVFGRFDESLGDTVIYVVNPDGSHLRAIRPGEIYEGPTWSPDGSRIALGHAVVDADGSNYRAWDQSGNAFNVECWDWSPDGQRMLCEGFSDSAADDVSIHGVYTVRASDGGDLRRLSEPGRAGIPGAYSPDGRMVAWGEECGDDGPCNLIVANVDGSGQRRLGIRQYGAGLAWAPDGRSILASNAGDLFSIDVATGQATQIVINGDPTAEIHGAQWSPDGTRILIKRAMGPDNNDLFTMLPDGTDLVQVTNDPDDDRFFDWGTHPIER